MDVLSVIIPIFLFALIGYILGKTKLIDFGAKNFISKIVYYLALPALILRSILFFDFKNIFSFDLVAVNVLSTLTLFALVFPLAFLIKNKKK